jgi:hypothetical protein
VSPPNGELKPRPWLSESASEASSGARVYIQFRGWSERNSQTVPKRANKATQRIAATCIEPSADEAIATPRFPTDVAAFGATDSAIDISFGISAGNADTRMSELSQVAKEARVRERRRQQGERQQQQPDPSESRPLAAQLRRSDHIGVAHRRNQQDRCPEQPPDP